jgi:hypothetical protein
MTTRFQAIKNFLSYNKDILSVEDQDNNVHLTTEKKTYTISKANFVKKGFIVKKGNNYEPIVNKIGELDKILPIGKLRVPYKKKPIEKKEEKEKEPIKDEPIKEEPIEEEPIKEEPIEEEPIEEEPSTSEIHEWGSLTKEFIKRMDKEESDWGGDDNFNEWWDDNQETIENLFPQNSEQIKTDIKELNSSLITMSPMRTGINSETQLENAFKDNQPVLKIHFIGSAGDKMLKFKADVYKVSKEGLIRKSDSFEIWKTRDELLREGFNKNTMISYARKLLHLKKKTYDNINVGKLKGKRDQIDYIMKNINQL